MNRDNHNIHRAYQKSRLLREQTEEDYLDLCPSCEEPMKMVTRDYTFETLKGPVIVSDLRFKECERCKDAVFPAEASNRIDDAVRNAKSTQGDDTKKASGLASSGVPVPMSREENNEENPSSDQQPAKKELTSQEWELQRRQNNHDMWARRKKSWADWKLQNPSYVKAKASEKLDKQLALAKKRWGPKA